MATHSSILAWRIPWTAGLVGCSPWGCKELGTTERLTLTQETEEGRPGYRCAELGQSQPAAHSG